MSDDGFRGLKLRNTLSHSKDPEPFLPLDWQDASIPENERKVRMYVCGPTVYDFAHIGNARPVIVFDVLYRLLRHLYGEKHVTYVRNITDVDDKINDRALRDFGAEIEAGTMSLNEAVARVTETTTRQFHADVKALGCLEPDFEPRATQHIDGMETMAQTLLDKGHAYVASGSEGREVLFDVSTMQDYGQLSNRRLEDQQAGARVEVTGHKRNPGDFVLWKESTKEQPGWPASFGWRGETVEIVGRPGWHIECSVMSRHHLGEVFDIHGGGLDLIFPHHENEIAQSRCAHETKEMARYWLHNGFLQLEGRKMAKSEGNFVTIHDLLQTEKFGGRKWAGEVLRLAMLMTHYREPIDFSVRKLEEAERILDGWYRAVGEVETGGINCADTLGGLSNDLNMTSAIAALHELRAEAVKGSEGAKKCLKASANLVGLLTRKESEWQAAARQATSTDEGGVERAIDRRLALIREKAFAEADRIRDELAGQGIQLMDYKDPETGERKTKWEVKR